MNLAKGKPKSNKPSSAGRVVGYGLSTKWGEYYKEDPKTRKERRSHEESREVQELRKKVAEIPQIVEDQVAKTITSILPTLLEGLGNWNAGGR